jgi:protein gp37
MKVSAGCTHCYAETYAHRFGVEWGPFEARKMFGEKHWNEPLKWDRWAKAHGTRTRVLCGSMCDVFESNLVDNLDGERKRLFRLIEATPNLTWMLLTKRPLNIVSVLPLEWMAFNWPENVWLGVSIEDQNSANFCLPILMDLPGKHWISCEPLVGPVNLLDATVPDGEAWMRVNSEDDESEPPEMVKECEAECDWINCSDELVANPEWVRYMQSRKEAAEFDTFRRKIHWIVAGGENGSDARPMEAIWLKELSHLARMAKIPFYFKQWGKRSTPETPPDMSGIDFTRRDVPAAIA